MCAVLYYQPSAPPDEEGHFLFRWNDDNCSSKNNFICKYPEGEALNWRLGVTGAGIVDRQSQFCWIWVLNQPLSSCKRDNQTISPKRKFKIIQNCH